MINQEISNETKKQSTGEHRHFKGWVETIKPQRHLSQRERGRKPEQSHLKAYRRQKGLKKE